VVLEKDEEDQFDWSREECRIKEERNILQAIKGRRANWISYVLCRN
jgi:hypothetical protein